METFESQKIDFVTNSKRNRKPRDVDKHWRYIMDIATSSEDACCNILHFLKLTEKTVRQISQQRITVIDSRCYK